MRKPDFKFILSVIVLYSMTFAATAKAAPVQIKQVIQVVNAKPGKAATGSFAQLRLAGDDPVTADDDETKKAAPEPQQDDRVITETRTEIVEDDVCDCTAIPPVGGGFPYGWLALGAVPLLFLIPPGDDDEPPTDFPPPPGSTPTPTPPPGSTPTPTPTPTETPTPTPTPTTTPTPPPTTPTPTPTPEPMTILLFGTGLAGVGFAARRKLGKKEKETKE